MSEEHLQYKDKSLWRDPNDPANRQRYCVSRPDGVGAHKPHCVSCSVDEEIKILRQYTFCAKKADCPTKYVDKPIWNTTTRLCEPCDPIQGCINTGDVRWHFPQPLKPMDCRPRGTEVKGERRCTCPPGWITDFQQDPDNFVWCNFRDWDHIYHIRRRAYEKAGQEDYSLVLVTSILGIVLSFCFVLCFLSFLRNTCSKIFPLRQPKRRFKHQMHGGKSIP